MIFKIRHEQRGGHIHCRLFAAKATNMTYATCGDFTVREEEFEDLQRVMAGVFFEDAKPSFPSRFDYGYNHTTGRDERL